MSSQTLNIKLDNSVLSSIESSLKNLDSDMSFLINLTPAEIKKSLKMGSDNYVFARKILLLAQVNSETIPSSIDLIKFEEDLELIKNLRAIQNKLFSLQEGVKDTLTALGSQSLKTANVCYGMMKESNKATSALDQTLAPILASRKHKKKSQIL